MFDTSTNTPTRWSLCWFGVGIVVTPSVRLLNVWIYKSFGINSNME